MLKPMEGSTSLAEESLSDTLEPIVVVPPGGLLSLEAAGAFPRNLVKRKQIRKWILDSTQPLVPTFSAYLAVIYK